MLDHESYPWGVPASDVRQLLHAHGLRDTPQRRQVLDILTTAAEIGSPHLSPGDVLARLQAQGSSIDQATVYRSLSTLVELGVVHEVNDGNGAAYGLAHHTHHHAVCTKCGSVSDLSDDVLGKDLHAVSEAAGFSAVSAVTLHGICASCQ